MNWYKQAQLFRNYWIDLNGQTIQVPKFEHWEFALDQLEKEFNIELGMSLEAAQKATEELMKQGYIRVVADERLYLESRLPANPAQMKAIFDLAKDGQYINGPFVGPNGITVNNAEITTVRELREELS